MPDVLPSARQFLVAGAVLTAVALLAGGLFVLSGLYNVSATREHYDVTNQLFELVRRRSIETHSLAVGEPPPEDAAMARLGAAHFELGCAPCHGSPERRPSAIASAMLPQPPPLDRGIRRWSQKELFWIVRHGQKFTGMPSWIAPDRADEVWSMAAFLRRLPEMDAPSYRAMAGLGEDMCVRCHGPPGGEPPTDLVPRLGGQGTAYLTRALREYADGKRASGTMQLVAATLSEDAIVAHAESYAKPSLGARVDPAPQLAGDAKLGEKIATQGLPAKGVPACLSCHEAAANPSFPQLDGLSARYIHQQLRLFQRGVRAGTGYADIMRPVAERLDDAQTAAVAAWLATR